MTDPNRSSPPSSSASDGRVPDEASSPRSASDAQEGNASRVPEPFREAVSALQEQVRAAAETIRELRAENARLKQQVEELSQRPDVSEDDVFIHLDGERAELRDRIQQFIDAIDDHLERSPDSGIEPDWPETPPEAPHLPDDLTGPPAEETDGASPTDAADTDANAADANAADANAADANAADANAADAETPTPNAQTPNAQTPNAQTPNAETPGESTKDEGESVLQDGLPDDGEFEVEVAEAASEDRTDESPCCPDDDPYEPRTLSPGLQPRRSARRRR